MRSLKKKSSLVALSVACLFSLFFVIWQQGNAQSTTDEDEETANYVVKIPPPIEGFVAQEHKKKPQLEKTDISILTSNGRSRNYTVELAINPEDQRVGMMFRKKIAPNTGMLFLFDGEETRRFWMKNTLVPLDMLFIRRDGVIHHIHHMAKVKSLKHISSQGKVTAVLEIMGGEAEKLGINIGDRVLYDAFLPGNSK